MKRLFIADQKLDKNRPSSLVVESLKVLEVATAHNLHPCPPQHAAHLINQQDKSICPESYLRGDNNKWKRWRRE